MSDFSAKVKRVALTIIDHRAPVWMPDGKMPASRAECPDTTTTMCGAVHCRHHLARVDSCDRAGRPSVAKVKRGSHGHTEVQLGNLGNERAGTTLNPLWLDDRGEFQFIETCSLDIANRGPQGNEAIGAVAGRHRTLIGRETKAAVRSLIKNGGTEQGLRLLADPEAANDQREPSRTTTRGRVGGIRRSGT